MDMQHMLKGQSTFSHFTEQAWPVAAPIETLVAGTRLRWFGHVARSSDWINRVTKLQVPGPQPRGRPKKTWQETVDKDRVEWRMQDTDPLDRDAWRAALQSRRKRGTIEPAG